MAQSGWGYRMLRRLMQVSAITILLAGPAAAQVQGSGGQDSHFGIPVNQQRPPTAEEIEKRKAVDSAYDAAVRKIPDKKSTADPWGTIRPTAPTAKNKQQQ